MDKNPILLAMGRIARIVSETLELRDVLARVGIEAGSVIPHDWMVIARIEESGALRLYSRTDDIPGTDITLTLADFSPALRPSLDGAKRIADIQAVADTTYSVDRQMINRAARSILHAPLRKGDRAVGLVAMESRRPKAFSPEHEAVLLSIADLLALAMEHERLWTLDTARRIRLESIDALFPIIANALDVREIFQQVSVIVKPVLDHDHMVLLSANIDQRVVHLDAYTGDFAEDLPASSPLEDYKRFPADLDFHLIGDVMAMMPVDSRDDPVARALGLRSALRIPIFIEGDSESTLNFLSREPNRYSEEDVPVARRVADLVSLALSHRKLAEEERKAALLERRVESLNKELETTLGLQRIVGRSRRWTTVLGEVAQVAPTETTVLLTGESGTGKEVLARMIRRESPRSRGPFVAINCAALPETLLESELFGHEKGAFTGAIGTRPGCIEQAAGGVLFLDEIGEMHPSVQAKMLRVIEQREFTRVGGSKPLKADVRIIAATNRDLKASLARGDFREDLYYRLRVFEIVAPPLRERREDIFPLAEAFLEEIGHKVARPAAGISNQAKDALSDYAWPGNVRELKNVLERATILCDGGLITLDHLPAEVSRPPMAAGRHSSDNPGISLRSAERALVIEALEKSGGNRSQAARILGISRPALYNRIRKFGLGPHPQKPPPMR